jgi:hypothetical protein
VPISPAPMLPGRQGSVPTTAPKGNAAGLAEALEEKLEPHTLSPMAWSAASVATQRVFRRVHFQSLAEQVWQPHPWSFLLETTVRCFSAISCMMGRIFGLMASQLPRKKTSRLVSLTSAEN